MVELMPTEAMEDSSVETLVVSRSAPSTHSGGGCMRNPPDDFGECRQRSFLSGESRKQLPIQRTELDCFQHIVGTDFW